MNKLPNIHPGEVLREEFIKPMRISQNALAKAIGVPVPRICAIVNESRSITADTAIRLGRFFDVPAQFWLNLQSSYDIEEAALEHDYSSVHTLSEIRV
ncbi:MAG: HigA family addiction module antitoxin [Alphaproteobacteria bacterium]|nr:HigA family addiction module antitoxin [Alphaproteobacteria bacterium]